MSFFKFYVVIYDVILIKHQVMNNQGWFQALYTAGGLKSDRTGFTKMCATALIIV